MKELSTQDARAVEDIVIRMVESRLISARMNQVKGVLVVSRTFGRDVRDDELPAIRESMKKWYAWWM